MASYEPIQWDQATAANYIVYILDGAGKICRSEWIAAANDEQALELIRVLKLSSDCELWQRDRRVGHVAAAECSLTRSSPAANRTPRGAGPARTSDRR